MNTTPGQIAKFFKGTFLTEPDLIQQKLFHAKAFVFDWDGVFNEGFKDEHGSSPFSEVDSMGTNMLRYNYYLRNGKLPLAAIITGEKNKASFTFGKREHFDAVYYKMPNKKIAFEHFCTTHSLDPSEIVWIFDDILDLAIAKRCGLRLMISRESNPLLLDFVKKEKLADYITFSTSGKHALREAAELLLGLSGKFDETIIGRSEFTDHYMQYLSMRNKPETVFYTHIDYVVTEQTPL